ncbi:TPA: hypothetical protein ACGO8F_001425 [Streptococcus suis]
MTIVGYQFDRARVSASKDAALYNSLANGSSFILANQGDGLAVTTSGLTVTVKTGMALICGRLVEVIAPITVSIPASSKGYLVIAIDLSESNTSSGTIGSSNYIVVNNQLSVKFVTSLTQQNISDGGLLYTFSLGAVTSTASAVTFTRSQGTVSTIQSLVEQLDLANKAIQAINDAQKVATRTASIGNGASGTLYRIGNKVRFEVSANQTSNRQVGSYTLAETIPSGYRPRIDTPAEVTVLVGTAIQSTRKLLLNFATNGQMYAFSENMGLSPLRLVLAVEWHTNEAFPTKDVN